MSVYVAQIQRLLLGGTRFSEDTLLELIRVLWKPKRSQASEAELKFMGSLRRLCANSAFRHPVKDSRAKWRLLSPALTQQCRSSSSLGSFYMRRLSQLVQPSHHHNGKRAFLVDTLQLVRRLEAQGLTAKQAEAITAVITEVLNDSLENVAQSFVSTQEMQRKELMQEAVISKLKTEILSQLENHVSKSQRETERLRTDLDKTRSELKYEIDKVTAGQRLDLNLERGRIRDELATQSAETANLTNKLDREIHTLKTQLEAAKYDVIKYCIGSIVSVTAVGLGLIRILM